MHRNDSAQPLVSILILSYRNTKGIFETLDSILKQDYPNLEIVISDDGTPGFSSVVPEIEKRISGSPRGNVTNFVICSSGVNRGTVKNVNQAIRRSGGRYIKTISPEDSFSRSDAISCYVDYMQAHDYLVVFAKLCGVNDAGERFYNLASCEYDYDSLHKLTPCEVFDKLCARNFLPGAAEFFDRKIFDKYGLFDESIRLIEDYTYWLHLAKNGVSFGYIDEYLVDYKLSGVSSSGHYSEMFMQDMISIYEKYIFPNDDRYGVFQPFYNLLKRAGLNFYVGEAKYEERKARLVMHRLEYLPFYLYTRLANKNKKN